MKIGRREFFIQSAALTGILAGCSKDKGRVPRTTQPNILFINTDDQARWAVGAYGNRDIITRNMDRLAGEGVLFSQAFTTPVCSPSRAMTMTGRYSHQVGVSDWISRGDPELNPEARTLADMLRSAGYSTGLVGKWHLGTAEVNHPLNRGFDFFVDGRGKMDPKLTVNRESLQAEGYLTDVLTDYALDFIRTRKAGKPFALFFHTHAPHTPYLPVPDQDMALYEGKTVSLPEEFNSYPETRNFPEAELQRITREYYASISSVDRNIGRLLQELESLGMSANTLVIFMGDNGYNLGRHGLMTKGNAVFLGTQVRRPNMFDSSAMIPLIIRWPGVIRPGTTCDALVSSLDFFPTLMEIAGGGEGAAAPLEGKSLMPLLRGEMPSDWRSALFGLYDMHHGTEAHMRMIRTSEWKLVIHLEDESKNELYDLKTDPGELDNLYSRTAYESIQKELESKLRAWMKSVAADHL